MNMFSFGFYLPDNIRKIKFDLLIYFVIIAPLLADILTGLFDLVLGVYLPFGIVIRTIILLFTFYLVLIHKNKLSKLILFITIFYLLLTSYWLVSIGQINLGLEIKTLFFLLLPFLVFHCFHVFKLNKDEIVLNKLSEVISLYGFIAATSIIICFFLDIGYESYGDYAFGFKGVFISGNDIGITIVLCSAFAWYRVYQYARFIDFLSAFTCFIGLLFIASRAGVIFGLFFLITGLFFYLFFTQSHGVLQRVIKTVISVLVVGILTLTIWLSIKYASDIMYHSVRLLELIDGVSPRKHLEFAADQVFESLTFFDILFGQGRGFYELIGEEHYLRMTLNSGVLLQKSIEKDFHDLYGYTGIVFTIFYTVILMSIPFLLVKIYFKNRTSTSVVVLVLFAFLIIHAVLAGHVIFGSQVPIIAAAIIFLGINDVRKRA